MRTVLVLAAIVALSSPAIARQQERHPVHALFTAGSDELTHMSRGQLDDFAREYLALKGKAVVIRGHATLAESEGNSPDFAVGFSQRRAVNVRSYLASRGVPHGVMITEAFGSTRPLEGTRPDATRNQRVEVEITEGSGW